MHDLPILVCSQTKKEGGNTNLFVPFLPPMIPVDSSQAREVEWNPLNNAGHCTADLQQTRGNCSPPPHKRCPSAESCIKHQLITTTTTIIIII